MKINSEKCTLNKTESKNAFYRKAILPGEIEGINTCFYKLRKEEKLEILPDDGNMKIYIFLDGKGKVQQKHKYFSFDEITLFVPTVKNQFIISSVDQDLFYLEIILTLLHEDIDHLNKHRQDSKLPYFIAYKDAKQYTESIKSAKTINRMLLPDDIVPRLCIGSVETTGPDRIATHSHPMLEQLFLGLAENNCVVEADNAQATFMDYDLLHIPLGSNHGVTVEKGKKLKYIWIDIFNSQEDMAYIKNTHFEEED